jgi:hypothetical protein
MSSKRNPTPPRGNPDFDAKAIEAFEEAQGMPPGAQRTEALKKARQLRIAAETYGYLFSNELKPPE